MQRPVDVNDVLQGKPPPGTLLKRGLLKRCPRCGGKGLFRSWFHQHERCPTCGYLFEREPGFFVGAYFINFAIAEGFLFVLVMGYVLWKDQHPDAGVVIPVAIGVAIGVILPILMYPFARTIWSAFDLLMTPLEMKEIVAAADAVGETVPDGPEADRAPGEGPEPPAG
jgi:uncharacterized protein (DUF983 family)